MQYSGVEDKEVGSIMVFQVGAVDLGARLDDLSQYPGICNIHLDIEVSVEIARELTVV